MKLLLRIDVTSYDNLADIGKYADRLIAAAHDDKWVVTDRITINEVAVSFVE